jgi:hypothetical protein
MQERDVHQAHVRACPESDPDQPWPVRGLRPQRPRRPAVHFERPEQHFQPGQHAYVNNQRANPTQLSHPLGLVESSYLSAGALVISYRAQTY